MSVEGMTVLNTSTDVNAQETTNVFWSTSGNPEI